jgi:hypothetical protein
MSSKPPDSRRRNAATDMPISTAPFLFFPEISMMNKSAQEKPGMSVSSLPE